MFNYCTPAAQLDTAVTVPQFDPGWASFDVPNRKLYARCGGFTGIAPTTVVEDEFIVLGLSAGTPVPLTARLATTTSGFCALLGTVFWASITEVDGSSIELRWNDLDPVQNPLLSLPIQAVAGAPFRMRYSVSSGSECFSWIEGTFSFDGLPAGATLASCKGFFEEGVSVRPGTWGSVKALYRGSQSDARGSWCGTGLREYVSDPDARARRRRQ